MAGYLDLEGGEPRRSIFLAAKTFDRHLRTIHTMQGHTIYIYSIHIVRTILPMYG